MPVKVEPGEFLRRILEARTADIWTSFPGQITAYDTSVDPPVADIQPMIRRPVPADDDGGIDFEDLPIIPNTPIMFPRGGGNAYTITWPLQVGDWVQVTVSIYSFSAWRRSGQLSDPVDTRSHALGNCWATPGMAPNGQALSQAGDSALVLEGPAIKIGKNATDFPALAQKVKQELTNIQTTLASAVAPSGGGPITYGTPYTPGDVKASKTKVE